jgi:hypothetical protein
MCASFASNWCGGETLASVLGIPSDVGVNVISHQDDIWKRRIKQVEELRGVYWRRGGRSDLPIQRLKVVTYKCKDGTFTACLVKLLVLFTLEKHVIRTTARLYGITSKNTVILISAPGVNSNIILFFEIWVLQQCSYWATLVEGNKTVNDFICFISMHLLYLFLLYST